MEIPLSSVTVIVPAYNIAPYIDECIGSVMMQSTDDWVCIIVDDGSTDGTAEKLSGYQDPRIKVISQTNSGVSVARNAGLASVSTPFVMFLDGDDILQPQALERLLAGFVAAPAAVAAFGALRKILVDGTPFLGEKPLERANYPSGDVFERMLQENFLANGGQALVRTAVAQKLGGFDESLKLSEDWEFWCRLALHGEFHYVGAPPEVFSLRIRPGSASGGMAADWNMHKPSIDRVIGNTLFASRFSGWRWWWLVRQIRASHQWECGRVNFTVKSFSIAHRHMISSLLTAPTIKRVVLYGIAIATQITGRSFASRLRFRDAELPQSR